MILFWLFLCAGGIAAEVAEAMQPGERQVLADGWQLKSSVLVPEPADASPPSITNRSNGTKRRCRPRSSARW